MKKTNLISLILLVFIFFNILNSNYSYTTDVYAAENPMIVNVPNTNYPKEITTFDGNGNKVKQEVFTRNANNKITEYLVSEFFSNGNLSTQRRFYDGKNISVDSVVYNKEERKEFDSNGNLILKSVYVNVHLNSGQKSVRILQEKNSYSNNRKVTSIITKVDQATNQKVSQDIINFRSNGQRQDRTITKFTNGNAVSKSLYKYNRSGELKSNSNGNAYKTTTNLETNNVREYQYNAKGKAIRK